MGIDKSQVRAVSKDMASLLQGYLVVILAQELPTKFLINKQDRGEIRRLPRDTKCPLCKDNIEDISSFNPKMRSRYYHTGTMQVQNTS